MKDLKKKVATAVRKWCAKNGRIVARSGVRHVHPRAFVVGYAAPQCLVVAYPWLDSEPQVRDFDKNNPLGLVRCFDKSLKPGDWCSMAYVVSARGGETVAIPVVK